MTHQYTPRRANLKRWLKGAPDYILDVLDNKGKSVDRYTVLFTGPLLSTCHGEPVRTFSNTLVQYLGLSDAPSHPQGVSMWGEMAAHEAAGYRYRCGHDRIRWLDLPEAIRNHVYFRVNEGEQPHYVTPAVQALCAYREGNLKIDLYRADGTFWQSTNHFRTCRDAVTYFRALLPLVAVAYGRINHDAR